MRYRIVFDFPPAQLEIGEDYQWVGDNDALVQFARSIDRPAGSHHAIDPLRVYVVAVVAEAKALGVEINRTETIDDTLLPPLPDGAIH